MIYIKNARMRVSYILPMIYKMPRHDKRHWLRLSGTISAPGRYASRFTPMWSRDTLGT
ncbi:TPA: hypothetical protein M4K80_000983 [Salmonella enterica]|nr:hypothetical protein [Salmonella enterica]